MKTYTYIVKRAKSRKKQTDRVSFVASTASPDRYGDIIDQKGWITSNYRKNPVVLLNHDSSQLPIGKGNVSIKNQQLVIDVEFDDEDPRAQEVKRKAQNGFMNAVSVGFRPLESKSRSELSSDSPYYGKRGMYYSKAELLEVSIVTIPANGEATMLEQKFLKDMKEEIITEIMDYLYEFKSIIKENMFVNKHILEVIEEDDRYVVSFAKGETEEPEEIEEIEEEEIEEEYKEEEEEEEEKDLSEESTEDMEKADKEEEEEKEDKDFNDLIEAFAYILTT